VRTLAERSAAEGLDLHDLDGDLAPVRRGVAQLLADLAADDGLPDRARLGVDVEILGVGRDLAVAEQELRLLARDLGRDEGAGGDGAIRRRSLADGRRAQQLLELQDACLDLALLVFRGVIAAVLLEVALLARRLDLLGDVDASGA